MRQPRIKAPPHHPLAYYHCVSRVVDQQFKFGPDEMDQFIVLMREYADFCGVHVESYCIMNNHFHLLVGVPKRPEDLNGHEWLLERLDGLTVKYPVAQNVRQKILKYLKEGAEELVQALVEGYMALMWDISPFMKLLKQRFTQIFNQAKDRKGTLWESRFHSTLVEGTGNALAGVAAYIELNPVRAKIVADPANYKWSSYGMASRGDINAMEGIRKVVAGAQRVADESMTLEEGLKAYRGILIGTSANDAEAWNESQRAELQPSASTGERNDIQGGGCGAVAGNVQQVPLGPTKAEILKRVLGDEPVSLPEYVQIRVRYFTDGGVLGSKDYVELIFHELRDRFGPKRTVVGSPVQGLDPKAGFFSLRSLKKRLFG